MHSASSGTYPAGIRYGESDATLHGLIRRLFDSMDEGIIIIDRDFSIAGANRQIADTLGLEVESIVGRKCYVCLHDRQEMCADCLVACSGQQGRPVEGQCRLSGRDHMVAVHPTIDDAGGIDGYVLRFRDMAERRHTEQYLSRSNRLIALGELAAGVAHNFGNILMGVSATMELLQMRASRESSISDLCPVITGAQEQVSRGAELIQRLLALARGVPSLITAVDPKSIAANALALCSTHPLSKRVRLMNDISDGVSQVRADAGQLEEVVVNLVLNALQASNGGTVRIGVRDDHGDKMVELYVSDEGSGIPAEHVGRVFDPFFSGRSDRPGTGLGLSCALAQINRMGGTIAVQSRVGEGSVFTISLPRWTGAEIIHQAA